MMVGAGIQGLPKGSRPGSCAWTQGHKLLVADDEVLVKSIGAILGKEAIVIPAYSWLKPGLN